MNLQQERLTLLGRIVGLREGGASIRAISLPLGISKSTVERWLQRWEESGDLRNRAGGRPPRRTTPEDDHRIQQAAL